MKCTMFVELQRESKLDILWSKNGGTLQRDDTNLSTKRGNSSDLSFSQNIIDKLTKRA